MDAETHLGIKELWGIAATAAYLQSFMPAWFGPWVITQTVLPFTRHWKVFVGSPEPDFSLTTDYVPPHSDIPTMTVELEMRRVLINIGSELDGVHSIGYGGYRVKHLPTGSILYWVYKAEVPKHVWEKFVYG